MRKTLHAARESLDRIANWKKHPASVFYLAVPLALIGLGSSIAVAVLQARQGDPWYAVIVGCALALLALGLWPIRHQLARSLRS